MNEHNDEPEFLKIKSGDTLLMNESEIEKVFRSIGGSRDPDTPTLFQTTNIDTAETHWVRVEKVKDILFHRDS